LRESELRTAFLVSGGGTTAEAVIQAIRQGRLKGINPVAVIGSRPNLGGVAKAKALDIPTYVVSKKQYPGQKTFGHALLTKLRLLGVDLVSQNGWLVKTPAEVVEAFSGMIINQHPGPLDPPHPDFGGKGMYGARVTAARLWYLSKTALNAADQAYTEATTHHVTTEYDQGPLIQTSILALSSVFDTSRLAQLATDYQLLIETTLKVQQALLPMEHANVIATLQTFADGTPTQHSREARLIPTTRQEDLELAKTIAISLFPQG
jgi:phosphoribosylglycinamide formyltransferase-1